MTKVISLFEVIFLIGIGIVLLYQVWAISWLMLFPLFIYLMIGFPLLEDGLITFGNLEKYNYREVEKKIDCLDKSVEKILEIIKDLNNLSSLNDQKLENIISSLEEKNIIWEDD